MKRTKIKKLLHTAPTGAKVCVKGWVRTKRTSKHVVFIALNDGSTIHNLQLVTEPSKISRITDITTGASLAVEGTIVSSQGGAQHIELQAEKITILGTAAPDKYPLQPKRHSLEFLRGIAHLRFRTNTFGAVFRVRHAISYAIHQFFHERGFVYIHTPIITGSDAEGAGDMFRVTTLDAINPPKKEDGRVDFQKDFFGQETNLTVSGQLEGETAALALGEIYTFGPTFRAENSNTTRHLAEFWMIEPEMAFYNLNDNIELAEALLKYLIRFVLDHCKDDLAFLDKRAREAAKSKKQQEDTLSLIERLAFVLSSPFEKITYTEAIDILRNATPNKKKKFFYPIQEWGVDLQSEHERYLVEKHFKKPVVITNYPQAIKAFYMRQNKDGKTVAAMDILFPAIGEIVGGSQREERFNKLCAAIQRLGMDQKEWQWYLATRLFGSVPHSGFGLGLERFVQFVTGMENIRDVIPFPRTPRNAVC
ncbi:MAG: asparagine--tRNA ligase [Cytophagales bacterium]|nr:asparagine--tRNA ligase [Cytophagales bacterium]